MGGHAAGRSADAGQASPYPEAAWVLREVLNKRAALKTLINSPRVTNRRRTFALVSEALKYRSVLLPLLLSVGVMRETKLDEATCTVIAFDLLLGQRHLRSRGRAESLVIPYRPRLVAALQEARAAAGVSKNEDLLPEHIRRPPFMPRYARVNTILASMDDVIKAFEEEKVPLLGDDVTMEELEALTVAAGKKRSAGIAWMQRDNDIPNLLRFPPNTDFHAHPLYLTGRLILQDKASCFPAHVLSPPPGSFVIDGCAAPGNKTSHVAAIMGNVGTVVACDISARRLDTLRRLTTTAGATIVQPRLQSFLDLDPHSPDCAPATHILLDPSCSGSGIVSRLDALIDGTASNDATDESDSAAARLDALADFQTAAVTHAFTFPNVRHVTYSTCSIHVAENEGVVSRALEASGGRYRLARAMPGWGRRGVEGEGKGIAEAVVRTDPVLDHTIGFFVALFERVPGADPLPYVPKPVDHVDEKVSHVDEQVNHEDKTTDHVAKIPSDKTGGKGKQRASVTNKSNKAVSSSNRHVTLANKGVTSANRDSAAPYKKKKGRRMLSSIV